MTTNPTTSKRKKLRPGDLVRVTYPLDEYSNNPAHKLEGQEFVIKTRHQPFSIYKPQFTLYKAVSDAGMPYWFLEDELIPMGVRDADR